MRVLVWAVLAGLWAFPVLALTADDLWQNAQSQAETQGMRLSAEITPLKDGLRLTDLRLVMRGATEPLLLAEVLEATDAADGSVTIGLLGPMQVRMHDGQDSLDLRIGGAAARLRISHSAQGNDFSLLAEQLTVALAADDPAQTSGTARSMTVANLDFGKLNAGFSFSQLPLAQAQVHLASALFRVDTSTENDQTGAKEFSRGEMRGGDISLMATLPVGLDWLHLPKRGGEVDVSRMMRPGFVVRLISKDSGSSGVTRSAGSDLDYAATYETKPSSFRFDVAADGLSFDMGMDGIFATLDLPKLGLKHVGLSLGPLRLTTRLPVGEVRAPWQFALKLDDIATNVAGWALLDPSGGFGHDPAQFDLDLSGLMKMSVAQILAKQDAVIYAMDLNRFVLQALGAKITASGGLTMDTSDPDAVPVGKGTARMTGVTAVLEEFIRRGVIPSDAVMGLRYGLAMLTDKPKDAGPDQDVLQSDVEIRPDGHVFVNNQQIK
ncbi:MAG: DUF2125 domain-containing protein [Cypionkella sp.]